MVGGVSLINEATTSSKNQTAAFKKKLFRSRMLKGRLKRLSAFPVSQHWGGLYLYYDERRDIRWNIAWARGKTRGRSLRDFPRAQAIFYRLSWLESKYRHSNFLKVILPVVSFLVGQYWKSWFSLLVWQLGLYFPVLPSRWSNTGPYRPSRELCCGSTRKYTWSRELYYNS